MGMLLRQYHDTGADVPVDTPAPQDGGELDRPNANAKKEEWIDYAVALGLDIDASSTRSDIIALVDEAAATDETESGE